MPQEKRSQSRSRKINHPFKISTHVSFLILKIVNSMERPSAFHSNSDAVYQILRKLNDSSMLYLQIESVCFLDVTLSKKEQVSNYSSFLSCLSFIVYLYNELISSEHELPRLFMLPSFIHILDSSLDREQLILAVLPW